MKLPCIALRQRLTAIWWISLLILGLSFKDKVLGEARPLSGLQPIGTFSETFDAEDKEDEAEGNPPSLHQAPTYSWDGEAGLWGYGIWGEGTSSQGNWVGNENPIDYADVTFGNDVVGGNLNVLIWGGDRERVVSSMTFDNPTGYTISGGTIVMDSNGKQPFTSIVVNDRNGRYGTTHTISSNILARENLHIENRTGSTTLQINGSLNLEGNSLQISGKGTTTLAGQTIKGDQVTKEGSGTLSVTGNLEARVITVNGGSMRLNNETGNALTTEQVILRGGTLFLDKDNQIDNSATLELAGGTLATGGYSDTLGSLTLSNTSVIDLGNGSSVLHFDSSASQDWSGELHITNWDGNAHSGNGNDQIVFGDDGEGLSQDQLSQIRFINPEGYEEGIYGAMILENGEVVPLPVPVPEPGTAIGAIALFGLALLHERKRIRAWWSRRSQD